MAAVRGFILVMVFLAMCVAGFRAVAQWWAVTRVVGVHWGLIGSALVAFTVWPIIGLPAVLYYSLLKNYPGLWHSPGVGRWTRVGLTVGLLLGFSVAAEALSAGIAWLIGWAADLTPCESFKAGVTGSQLPDAGCA